MIDTGLAEKLPINAANSNISPVRSSPNVHLTKRQQVPVTLGVCVCVRPADETASDIAFKSAILLPQRQALHLEAKSSSLSHNGSIQNAVSEHHLEEPGFDIDRKTRVTKVKKGLSNNCSKSNFTCGDDDPRTVGGGGSIVDKVTGRSDVDHGETEDIYYNENELRPQNGVFVRSLIEGGVAHQVGLLFYLDFALSANLLFH
ncbi:unnamed protein product [Protopolystoma xenopodis]|uniref:Uncharacterized protein n=1 Tax=Protopolystoma xenopodis TaxID=117903 RepID=A0A448WKP4_9PLAT|nr:unnamed protein product [Protopolystoma xenopodis]